MTEWKEYMTVEMMTLIVAIATLIVTILAYRYARKSNKRNLQNLIASKEAQLEALDHATRFGVNVSEAGSLRAKQSMLKAEIEQLKRQL